MESLGLHHVPLVMLSPILYEIVLAVVAAISVAYLKDRTGRRRLPYPPGPIRLPIVGNLFNMPSREEWVTYAEWSKDCGMRQQYNLIAFTTFYSALSSL